MLHRGDVVALPAPRAAKGHEQRGARYAIVLQSSAVAGLSTVIVAPTSTAALDARFRPVVRVRGRKTRVLVEQIRTVDAGRLGRSVGHLAAHEVTAVDESLKLVLGLF